MIAKIAFHLLSLSAIICNSPPDLRNQVFIKSNIKTEN